MASILVRGRKLVGEFPMIQNGVSQNGLNPREGTETSMLPVEKLKLVSQNGLNPREGTETNI